jgi:hypothetical protein
LSVTLLAAVAGGLFSPDGRLSSFGGGDLSPEGTLSSFGAGLLTPEGSRSSFGTAGDFTPEGILSSFGIAGDFTPEGVRSSLGGLVPLGLRSSFGICFLASEAVRCVGGFGGVLSVGIFVEFVVCAVERPKVGIEGMLVGIDGRYDDARAVYDCVSGFFVLLVAALLIPGALSDAWWMTGACLSVLDAVFAASEVCFPACLLAESATVFGLLVAFLPALVGVAVGLPRLVMLGMLGKLGR